MPRLALIVAVTACAWLAPAGACNPDPPVPPILEDHQYDAMARAQLSAEADTVAVGRLQGRLDFVLEEEADGDHRQPDYLFELREGWKEPPPAQLPVPGHWVSCELTLEPGALFLLYLQGSTPLFILPAEAAHEDVEALGDLDWFYTSSGQLIQPELLEGLGGEPAGAEPEP